MVTLPDRIDADWIRSLSDSELVAAESALRASFAEEESIEKRRQGSRYDLFRGPAELTHAWLRWSMVSNAARSRGLSVRYRV